MTKKISELQTGVAFAGEGVGDDFSCAEFPRLVPRICAENAGPHVFNPGKVIDVSDAVKAGLLAEFRIPATSKGEPRKLRVSVWCGFAHLVADVTVEPGDKMPVAINDVWGEPGGLHTKFGISEPDLDRIGVKRASGFVTLREAIEARAREEAFA